jgi:la-related protein 1
MSTSTFSYAQAAKGQLASQAATSQQSIVHSQTPSIAGTQSHDTTTTNNSTRAPSIAVSTSSNDIDSSRSARSTSAKPETPQLNGAEANQDDANTANSVIGSVDLSNAGTGPSSVDGRLKATEPRGHSTNTTEDTSEDSEGKKGRRTKKGRSVEKESECEQEPEKEGHQPKVELSEAPVPSVNFWVQRQQQQQAAKAKITDRPVNTGIAAAQKSPDAKVQLSNIELAEINRSLFNGKQGSKRDGETSRNSTNQGLKKVGPRTTRVQDKEPETNLLASNPASWPTPETAAVNLKSQSQTQSEKPEKDEKDEASTAKPKQKKEWVQLPNFVPTVKFETALPTRGPRGGRVGGSRGGRDTTTGHHTISNPTGKIFFGQHPRVDYRF